MKIELGKEAVSAEEIARSCKGRIIRGGSASVPVSSVSTDSRDACPGSLFLAIPGAKTDGHLYISAAAAAGASAVLCEREPEGDTGNTAVILTDSTVAALGRFAAKYGRGSCRKRIAVTGSVGKTATKEMTYSVLSASGSSAFRSEGNLNSVIGMPLSFLSARAGTEYGVFEMGLGQTDEISAMSRICRPDIAAISVLGNSHIGNVGSRERLAFEKLSVRDGLSASGRLLLPAGEPLFADAVRGDPRAMTFSVRGKAGIYAENIMTDGEKTRFDAVCPEYGRHICGLELGVPGIHNVSNSLVAVASGIILGLDDETIRAGLEAYRPVKLRLQFLDIAGARIVNDCYNASPESMKAAFAVLKDLYTERTGEGSAPRRIAVLGDMYELGDRAIDLHREVGMCYAESGGDYLITLGRLADAIAVGASERIPEDRIFRFPEISTLDAPAKLLAGLIRPGDLVLIKASRAVGAERIAEYLKKTAGK
ncbi:MAG: UDP-N-acetylmuramoyl-tripeptide--D-alanyl-D-alanine ligase [Clostridia bacterium]|jgi:UDP-N-acetylmuramoyl-tripeptide--D-alanyl-D-alanine ligase|nr:UDP-N-acetylmuramoyl-tripeptide--D-alanyl-D-alanine ligase [Clostridia bacterium]